MGLFSAESPDFDQSMDAIRRGKRYQRSRLRESRRLSKPYRSMGKQATGQLMAQMGMGGEAFDVTQLPGYQQALEQGLGAVNQAGAGAGMLMSGSRLEGLQQAGQDVFGQYYGDYMNRLMNMSGRGQQAAFQQAGMGMQTGQNIMGAQQQMGNLMAQEAMADAQAQNAMRGDIMGVAGTLGGMAMGGGFGGLGGMADTTGYGMPTATPPISSGGSFNIPENFLTQNYGGI